MSAVVGGTVTLDAGNHIFARGICWGTEPNPNINGNHIAGDNVSGGQSVTLAGLTSNTVYYVRAYVVTDYGLTYGEEQSFTSGPLPSYTVTISFSPTDGGTATGGGIYEEGQSCTVSATANDGYAFTNWTENGIVVSISPTYSFIVDSDRTLMANFISGDHAYVDLGLPSGLLWATCNVGAYTPEGYGDYFAWGETQPKETYDWSTYQHSNGGSYQTPNLTKYCYNSNYGYNGYTDNLTVLLPEDDAAAANWGNNWRMPTKEEFQELLDHTSHTLTNCNGVNGWLFSASNGNTIFLPAAGGYHYNNHMSADFGEYWTSSLSSDSQYDSGESIYSWLLICPPDNHLHFSNAADRESGCSVRAVRSSTPTGAINGKFTINANGDQVYFSQGNLQYQASTNTWRFAENQYDYVGSTNSNISSSYNGWIDLFGWGTSGYNHGAICYQPWSTSQTDHHYYAYGDEDYNLNDETGQADWGYNSIWNGGNQQNQWRTLSEGGWCYILYTRTTISGIRFAKAIVNNVKGVVLLPDNWNVSIYALSSTNNKGASFSSNIITTSQWSTLEQNGVVFLPAAGLRSGSSVNNTNTGNYGFYWSASHRDDCDSWYFEFSSDDLDTDYDWRYYGGSVRLVQDVE